MRNSTVQVEATLDAQLATWWQDEFAELVAAGVDIERAADHMLAVGAARMGEAVGVRCAGRVLYLLAMTLAKQADQIDAATASATAKRGRT